MLSQLKNQLKALSESNDIAEEVFKHAQVLFINGQCQLLSQSKEQFDFWVSDEFNDTEVSILIEALGDNEEEETQYHFSTTKKGKVVDWDKNSVACLMQLSE